MSTLRKSRQVWYWRSNRKSNRLNMSRTATQKIDLFKKLVRETPFFYSRILSAFHSSFANRAFFSNHIAFYNSIDRLLSRSTSWLFLIFNINSTSSLVEKFLVYISRHSCQNHVSHILTAASCELTYNTCFHRGKGAAG